MLLILFGVEIVAIAFVVAYLSTLVRRIATTQAEHARRIAVLERQTAD